MHHNIVLLFVILLTGCMQIWPEQRQMSRTITLEVPDIKQAAFKGRQSLFITPVQGDQIYKTYQVEVKQMQGTTYAFTTSLADVEWAERPVYFLHRDLSHLMEKAGGQLSSEAAITLKTFLEAFTFLQEGSAMTKVILKVKGELLHNKKPLAHQYFTIEKPVIGDPLKGLASAYQYLLKDYMNWIINTINEHY